MFCATIDAFCMFAALLDRLHVAVLRFPGDFRQEKRKYLRNRREKATQQRKTKLTAERSACMCSTSKLSREETGI